MRKNLHPLAAFGAKENIATIANGLNRTIRPFFTLRRFFRRHSCKNCTPTSEVFFRQILQSSPVEHQLFRVAHFFKRPPISALESAHFFRAANGLVGRRCLGGGNYFGVFQKGVAGAFDGVVKPLCPLRPLRRGLPRPKSGFLVFRAECGYVDLFLQIFLLCEHFVDFSGQTVQRGCMAPAGRMPAPPLNRRFSVHSFKFCTTSMSQYHIVLGCLRRALCPALR